MFQDIQLYKDQVAKEYFENNMGAPCEKATWIFRDEASEETFWEFFNKTLCDVFSTSVITDKPSTMYDYIEEAINTTIKNNEDYCCCILVDGEYQYQF
jgi:hypothetical protein